MGRNLIRLGKAHSHSFHPYAEWMCLKKALNNYDESTILTQLQELADLLLGPFAIGRSSMCNSQLFFNKPIFTLER